MVSIQNKLPRIISNVVKNLTNVSEMLFPSWSTSFVNIDKTLPRLFSSKYADGKQSIFLQIDFLILRQIDFDMLFDIQFEKKSNTKVITNKIRSVINTWIRASKLISPTPLIESLKP